MRITGTAVTCTNTNSPAAAIHPDPAIYPVNPATYAQIVRPVFRPIRPITLTPSGHPTGQSGQSRSLRPATGRNWPNAHRPKNPANLPHEKSPPQKDRHPQ
jgi:hypothetical protein